MPPEGYAATALALGCQGTMGTLTAFHLALEEGITPHEVHAHACDELVVVLSGEIETRTADWSRRLGPGSFNFLAPGTRHNNLPVVATQIVVFKWQAPALTGSADSVTYDPRTSPPPGDRIEVLHEGATPSLARLRCLRWRMPPGAALPRHTDEHDLIVVLLEGRVRTLTHVTPGPAVLYHGAGTPHALANDGPDPVSLLAFELTGRG